jgi:HSP90 family molecular chaperone
MYVIRIDINRLKNEEVLWRTKESEINIFQNKENKYINIKDKRIVITKDQLISIFGKIKRS